MQPSLTLRLQAIRWQAEDILSLELRDPSGVPLPPWDVGAHIDVTLPNGMVRSYSLVNQPHDNQRYVITVALDRQSRGGSRLIHQALRPGQLLKIGVPRNHFVLIDGNAPVVLIAGGIGVTPLYAMAGKLAAARRAFQIVYSARSRSSAAYVREIAALGGAARFHFDAERQGKFLDMPAIVATAPSDAHFYCCGPGGMLSAFEQATAHLPAERVHIERFAAPVVPAASSAKSFTVKLAHSGRELDVPVDKSLLNALLDAGVKVPYSCTDGICGSCEVGVLAGEPEHRDYVLSNEERAAGKTMMVCVSRCKGDKLTLDL